MPATLRTTVRVNSALLDSLPQKVRENARKAVDETAVEIQVRARQMAPRDTGSLSESIYVNNGETSDYSTRTSAARALNRGVVILEEIRPDLVISLGGGDPEYSAVVGVAVEHGAPVEFGTRFMAPKSYMTPAVEPQRDAFVERMKKIVDV